MRTIFFGTPEFALESLKRLISSRHQVLGVVTQPDKAQGRWNVPVPSPVKEAALKAGLAVYQPNDLKSDSFLSSLKGLKPELGVVVSYGRLLPRSVLGLFPKGAINLHASFLPKYRGAAPIAWALIRGETETGVTVFQMDEQIDHGPIWLQVSYPIRPEDTAITLSQGLSRLGSEALLTAIDAVEAAAAQPRPQEEAAASLAPRLKKEDGLIDWSLSSQAIHHRVRGLQPWPGAFTHLSGKTLKLFSTAPFPGRHEPTLPPGTVVKASPSEGFWVQTGKGQLKIERLQLEGGKPLSAPEFLRGHRISPGIRLL